MANGKSPPAISIIWHANPRRSLQDRRCCPPPATDPRGLANGRHFQSSAMTIWGDRCKIICCFFLGQHIPDDSPMKDSFANNDNGTPDANNDNGALAAAPWTTMC
jgi:hypothetical protein